MKCSDLIFIAFFCGLLLMFLIMQPHTNQTQKEERECMIYMPDKDIDWKQFDLNKPIEEKQETETGFAEIKDCNGFGGLDSDGNFYCNKDGTIRIDWKNSEEK